MIKTLKECCNTSLIFSAWVFILRLILDPVTYYLHAGIKKYPHKFPFVLVLLFLMVIFILSILVFWYMKMRASNSKILYILITLVIAVPLSFAYTPLFFQIVYRFGSMDIGSAIAKLLSILFYFELLMFIVVPFFTIYMPVFKNKERSRYLLIAAFASIGSSLIISISVPILASSLLLSAYFTLQL